MDTIKINDTYVAATLITLGFNICEIEKSNSSKVIFHFPNENNVNNAVRLYFLGELVVNPVSLFQSYKYVLSKLHDHDN